MRVEWVLNVFYLDTFRAEFHRDLAVNLDMQWQLTALPEVPRVAIFVSQYLHRLADILHRQQSADLR